MYFRNGFGSVWIGFNDITRDGDFIWSATSVKSGYTHWNGREPNGGTNENCVHMFLPSGFWNDLRCAHSLPYICQRGGLPVPEVVPKG